MKVCFLSTSYPAYQGDARSVFLHELTRSLTRKGVGVEVVCPYYKDSVAKRETWDNVKINRFSYFIRLIQTLTESGGIEEFLKSPYLCLQLFFYLVAMFFTTWRVSKNCEVIHCQWALSGLIGVLVGKMTGKKVIVTLRGQDIHALKSKLMKPVFMFVVKQADVVTSNNDHHQKTLENIASVLIIRNGVDTKRFTLRNQQTMRKKLKLPKGPLILYVGRFVDVKNVGMLIDAMPDVVKKLPDVHVALVADGPLREELEAQTKKLGVTDQILFLGEKQPEEIPLYYNAADCLVLCSLSEGMPNVVLEAFASNVPVIATKVGGIPELIDDGVNGFLVPSKDSNALARQLVRLLTDTALQKKFTKNGQTMLVKKNLTWERCAEQYIKLYSTS
jgi:glycosyltransferase involved in cell wall biosynthesis